MATLAVLCEDVRGEIVIPVAKQPTPATFVDLVHKPGMLFLSRVKSPSTDQWNKHAYWRKILPELHLAYNGICAYSCHWIAYDTGADTVEHFIPKSVAPAKAYNWSNYRLVCAVLNSRKREFRDVIDPFQVKDGWFVIRFPSLLVVPGKELPERLVSRVQKTINRLGLNDEDTCMKSREKYIKDYCLGKVTFGHLEDEAPFIARELSRQGLTNTIKTMMQYRLSD
ncbi:MAG: hypothetical protein LLG01_17130 [Planctomycetaceae bacterium]|nr:hypothetical protein [Planctomycetaceae bacterium]